MFPAGTFAAITTPFFLPWSVTYVGPHALASASSSRPGRRCGFVEPCAAATRYRKFYEVGDAQKKFKRLQDSLSEFRSIIKFFKPLGNVEDANDILAKKGALTWWDYARLTSLLSDTGYKLGDNVEYLSAYKILPYDPDQCERYSKTFQFFAYLLDVLIGLKDIADLLKRKFESEEKRQKALRKKYISFIGDFADFIRVTPGFCAMYKIGGIKKHDGFSGICGVVVGVVGCYKVWQKTGK